MPCMYRWPTRLFILVRRRRANLTLQVSGLLRLARRPALMRFIPVMGSCQKMPGSVACAETRASFSSVRPQRRSKPWAPNQPPRRSCQRQALRWCRVITVVTSLAGRSRTPRTRWVIPYCSKRWPVEVARACAWFEAQRILTKPAPPPGVKRLPVLATTIYWSRNT